MSNSINGLFQVFTPTEEQKAKMYREIMKQSTEPSRKSGSSSAYRWGRWVRTMTACVALLLLSVVVLPFLEGESSFSVYAYGTDTEITGAGVELSTGIIHDDGSMQGQLLQFNVQGGHIENIRFSSKNQFMEFTDWTEKRQNYSMEKQFTVSYGKKTADYYYLVVNWNPEHTIRELTDHPARTITNLSEGLRNDIIVMEVMYMDGTTATKAIYITIQDNGKILAKLQDYVVTDKDEFVLHPPKNIKPQEKPENVEEPPTYDNAMYSEKEFEAAREVARTYYSRLRLPKEREIVEINYVSNLPQATRFIPDEYKDWQVIAFQTYEKSMPDIARAILLARENSSTKWIVINEGY
jgi:hypothetical protein